jgi:RNA polymerase sigma factor (sigma-70 family)
MLQVEPLLSAEEEVALGVRARGGDKDARDRLILSNIRLVKDVARHYRDRGLPLDDLVAHGNVGLIEATDSFEPRRNCRFSTHACWHIKYRIREALHNSHIIPVRHAGRTALARWKSAERDFLDKYGVKPDDADLLKVLGFGRDKYRTVKRAEAAMSGRTYLEFEHPASDLPEFTSVDIDDVLDALAKIDARERRVISLRLGLEGGDGMTLEKIGGELGFSKEYARRLYDRAIEKVRVLCGCQGGGHA